jgi:hypothetical protein
MPGKLTPKEAPTALNFEAKMKGVAGFTGSGVVRYALSAAGSANYETTLRGVAGLRCELFVAGEYVATLACADGKVASKFDSRLGDPAIQLADGDAVEIRQNGGVILQGVLAAKSATAGRWASILWRRLRATIGARLGRLNREIRALRDPQSR